MAQIVDIGEKEDLVEDIWGQLMPRYAWAGSLEIKTQVSRYLWSR